VIDCYAQLQAEGQLITRGGSSTRVASVHTQPPAPPVRAAPQLAVDFGPACPIWRASPREVDLDPVDVPQALGDRSGALRDAAQAERDYAQGGQAGQSELPAIRAWIRSHSPRP
jgi:hypothetical protein